jgi:hypothetical protein
MPIRVFLGGEGPNELGGWFAEPEFRGESPRVGVLEALLRRVRADGWDVVGAVRWMKIRKYRAGGHADDEQRNVLGLALMASEHRADIIAFSRDSDGDRGREASVEAGIAAVGEKFPDGPRVAGGVAVQTVEAWILALAGRSRTEEMSRAKLVPAIEALLGAGNVKQTDRYIETVEQADLAKLAADASSLRRWIERASAALTASGAG